MITSVSVVGLEDIRRRLLSMSAAASDQVLNPLILRRLLQIQPMMQARAPIGKAPRDPHPGRLRAGIYIAYLRSGVGYSKWAITLKRDAYYGLFQELGLGGKISAKTQARYNQFSYSKGVQRGLAMQGYTREQIIAAKRNKQGIPSLNRYELKRQVILARGHRLQGGYRRRNMAAQPFFRPIMAFVRQWFVDGVAADVWNAFEALSAPTVKAKV